MPGGMPSPTPTMVEGDKLFDAIYKVIKSWDVNVPEYYQGYCHANGSHATLIYHAVREALDEEASEEL
jgi:hypothetical protein